MEVSRVGGIFEYVGTWLSISNYMAEYPIRVEFRIYGMKYIKFQKMGQDMVKFEFYKTLKWTYFDFKVRILLMLRQYSIYRKRTHSWRGHWKDRTQMWERPKIMRKESTFEHNRGEWLPLLVGEAASRKMGLVTILVLWGDTVTKATLEINHLIRGLLLVSEAFIHDYHGSMW